MPLVHEEIPRHGARQYPVSRVKTTKTAPLLYFARRPPSLAEASLAYVKAWPRQDRRITCHNVLVRGYTEARQLVSATEPRRAWLSRGERAVTCRLRSSRAACPAASMVPRGAGPRTVHVCVCVWVGGCHHVCRARTRGRQRACDCRPLSRSAETTQLCSKLQGRPRQTARLRRECSVAGAHLVAAPAIVHNARQLVRVCVRRARQQPQQWSLRIFHHLSAADDFIRG